MALLLFYFLNNQLQSFLPIIPLKQAAFQQFFTAQLD